MKTIFSIKKRCGVGCKLFLAIATVLTASFSSANEPRTDYLSLSQGAIPIASGEMAKTLKVGMDRALLVIDGDHGGFNLTPKPGSSNTTISFIFQLPALTTFTDFAIPNVLETPSPSQTFFKHIEIAGSDQGPAGPFQPLASSQLKTHTSKGQLTRFAATAELPVRWLQLTLNGGIDIQREKTFFEFSEIIGFGQQQAIPLLETFTGKWKGRGVLLELKQEHSRVSGCYDRSSDLTGTVTGNLLHATGTSRSSGVPSNFVLTVTEDGAITGVRSTNGAPFRLYTANNAPKLTTECSEQPVATLGCDSIIHGIQFDFDSAIIRPKSKPLLNNLSSTLKEVSADTITINGHTSSEGSNTYNLKLSQDRAEAVVTALINLGVDAKKITAKGHGEQQPIADNTTGAGRSLNRRVEISCH